MTKNWNKWWKEWRKRLRKLIRCHLGELVIPDFQLGKRRSKQTKSMLKRKRESGRGEKKKERG